MVIILALTGVGAVFVGVFVTALTAAGPLVAGAGGAYIIGAVLSAIGLIIAKVFSGAIFVYALTFAFFGVLIQWLAEVCIYAVSFPLSAVNLAFGDSQKHIFIRHFTKGLQLMLVPALAAIVYATALVLFGSITADGGLLSVMFDLFVGNFSTALSGINSGVTGAMGNIVGYAIRAIVFGLFAPFILVVPLSKVMFATFSVAESVVGSGVQLVQGAVGGLGQTR
jgi:hypothetical protein